jgi:hypothetical protein
MGNAELCKTEDHGGEVLSIDIVWVVDAEILCTKLVDVCGQLPRGEMGDLCGDQQRAEFLIG